MNRQTTHAKMAAFINRYVALPDDRWADVLALWAIGTWTYMTEFDAYPYLVVTAATKQAGKTRLGAEILPLLCNNPLPTGGITPAALFRKITEDEENGITLTFDESESLFSEASGLRQFLNMGYRRGQKILRTIGGTESGVGEFEVYCPKVFILIGDVYDTLRDRSIVFELVRASYDRMRKLEIYESDQVKAEAADAMDGLTADTALQMIDGVDVKAAFREALEFLPARDAEIWAPIFAMARVICPSKLSDIRRVAADLAAMKTADKRKASELRQAEAEKQGEAYGERALKDLSKALAGKKVLSSEAAVEALKAIDVAPWRTYRGTGLTPLILAQLLDPFGVKPKPARLGTGRSAKVARGYTATDIKAALHKLG